MVFRFSLNNECIKTTKRTIYTICMHHRMKTIFGLEFFYFSFVPPFVERLRNHFVQKSKEKILKIGGSALEIFKFFLSFYNFELNENYRAIYASRS